jgi:hypothetical protein
MCWSSRYTINSHGVTRGEYKIAYPTEHYRVGINGDSTRIE